MAITKKILLSILFHLIIMSAAGQVLARDYNVCVVVSGESPRQIYFENAAKNEIRKIPDFSLVHDRYQSNITLHYVINECVIGGVVYGLSVAEAVEFRACDDSGDCLLGFLAQLSSFTVERGMEEVLAKNIIVHNNLNIFEEYRMNKK